LLTDSLLLLCLITDCFWDFSVLLRAAGLSPVDCCLVALDGSALLFDTDPEEGLELTDSDDLLLETVLRPAFESVFALLLTVEVDLFTALFSRRTEEFALVLSVALLSDLVEAFSEADLRPLLFTEVTSDGLSERTFAYRASPSLL
jgi:hypothetical protein